MQSKEMNYISWFIEMIFIRFLLSHGVFPRASDFSYVQMVKLLFGIHSCYKFDVVVLLDYGKINVFCDGTDPSFISVC